MKIKPNRKEVLRYAGFLGTKPDADMEKIFDEAERALCSAVTPRTVSRRFDCEVTKEGVSFGGYFFQSKKLANHLDGCKEIFLTAATLGVEADSLLRRLSITDMSRAAVMQATAAALIESVCDELDLSLAKEIENQGLFLKPRFSPGYGDLDIKYQREIFALLDCPRRIGLSLSDSYMMVPTKSVTAIVGITPNQQCHRAKCSRCPKTDCEFRQ